MQKLPLLISLLVLLAVPATALADAQQIYDDCQDNGRLDKPYSSSALRKALKEIPEDLAEYDGCGDLIRGALAPVDTSGRDPVRGAVGGTGIGGGGGIGGGTSGSSDLPSGNGVGSVPLGPTGKPLNPEIDARPDERQSLTEARSGASVTPTSAGVRPGAPDSRLPGPLVAVLVLVGLAAMAAGATGAKQLLSGRGATT